MKKIVITQTRSGIGRPERHKKIIQGLGLRKIGHRVIREDTPEIRGMVRKIQHLIKVEKLDKSREADDEA